MVIACTIVGKDAEVMGRSSGDVAEIAQCSSELASVVIVVTTLNYLALKEFTTKLSFGCCCES